MGLFKRLGLIEDPSWEVDDRVGAQNDLLGKSLREGAGFAGRDFTGVGGRISLEEDLRLVELGGGLPKGEGEEGENLPSSGGFRSKNDFHGVYYIPESKKSLGEDAKTGGWYDEGMTAPIRNDSIAAAAPPAETSEAKPPVPAGVAAAPTRLETNPPSAEPGYFERGVVGLKNLVLSLFRWLFRLLSSR